VHGPLDAARGLDRIVETGARYLVGVPTHAIDLLAQLGDSAGLGGVEVFQLAGSPVPTKLAESLLSRGVIIQNCFGMTENCSFMYTRGTDSVSVITGSCGRCCDGMEASVWNSDNVDEPVRDGEIGELGVRGASLMLGYFDDQMTTELSFNSQGWFMTGDLAQVDPGGNFRIVGRKKDLIIRGGRNIHPAHIENLAMRHPAVVKAAAISVADDRLGERVCIAVISADARDIDPDYLLEHLDDCGLSLYDMPEFYLQLSSFPQTASGKVLKRELAAMIADGRVVPRSIRWRPKQTVSSA
jgi:acyl-CoA synthetase